MISVHPIFGVLSSAENGSILPFAAMFFVAASNFWFFTFTDPKNPLMDLIKILWGILHRPFGLDPVPCESGETSWGD